VAETDGVTASFFKELLRRAALVSADNASADGDGSLPVGDRELRVALDQLLAERNRLTRILLGGGRDDDPSD
jgi:hypothetical protein